MAYDQQYSPIYLPQYNATIYRIPAKVSTGEMVLPNAEDDGYSVYLADNLTDEEAIHEAEHALDIHIKRHHHSQPDVQKIEAEAHGLTKPAPPQEPPKPKKKKRATKEKNYERLLRPDEYKKLGIDPALAPILKLTIIDTPPTQAEKKKFAEVQEDIAETAKKQKRRYY